jgi:hypothetical protein
MSLGIHTRAKLRSGGEGSLTYYNVINDKVCFDVLKNDNLPIIWPFDSGPEIPTRSFICLSGEDWRTEDLDVSRFSGESPLSRIERMRRSRVIDDATRHCWVGSKLKDTRGLIWMFV